MALGEGCSGRVALVTGASRGIGRAIAIRCAAAGMDIAAGFLKGKTAAEETRKAVAAFGRRCLTMPGDLRNASDVERIVRRTARELGRLDLLVNNAGVIEKVPLADLSPDRWDSVMDANLRSAYLCSRAAAPYLRESPGGGAIVNISSVAGVAGSIVAAHYGASKAGMIGLTRSLARELAPSVRVNAVAPGPVDTDLLREAAGSSDLRERLLQETPLGRLVTAEEVAGAVLFLGSPSSSYVTGEVLVVDGGRILR